MYNNMYVNPVLFKFPWVGPCFILSWILVFFLLKSKKQEIKNIFSILFIICLMACFIPVIYDSNPSLFSIKNTPFMSGVISAIIILFISLMKFLPMLKRESGVLIPMIVIPPFLGMFIGIGTYFILSGAAPIGIFLIVFCSIWVLGFFGGKGVMIINGKVVNEKNLSDEEIKWFNLLDNLKSIKNITFDEYDNYINIQLSDYSEIDYLPKTSWTKEEVNNYQTNDKLISEGMIKLFHKHPDIMSKYRGLKLTNYSE